MRIKSKIPFILSLVSILFYFSSLKAEIKVVVSIKPIHSLVSYIMDGVGTPDLIVDGYNSPHGFSLKPSHAKMLQEADMVVYVGEGIEEFLEKPLEVAFPTNPYPTIAILAFLIRYRATKKNFPFLLKYLFLDNIQSLNLPW